MKRNMSNLDRVIRLVISAVFAYLYFSGIAAGFLGLILLAVAVIFTLTSIFGFCPLYALFHLHTNKA